MKFAVLSFFANKQKNSPLRRFEDRMSCEHVVMMRMAVLFEMCSDRLIYLMRTAQWPSEQQFFQTNLVIFNGPIENIGYHQGFRGNLSLGSYGNYALHLSHYSFRQNSHGF